MLGDTAVPDEALLEHQRTVDLAEFNRLREEIDKRTASSTTLIQIELAAFAGAITVADRIPEVMLGLALVSSFLWLLWIDHTGQIYKIAAYISLRLAPRLREDSPVGLLGWEQFLRRLDASGNSAQATLFGEVRFGHVRLPHTKSISFYIFILFGCYPPLVIAAYLLFYKLGMMPAAAPSRQALDLFLALAGVALWLQALLSYRSFRRLIDLIDKAIAGDTVGTTAPTTPAPAAPDPRTPSTPPQPQFIPPRPPGTMPPPDQTRPVAPRGYPGRDLVAGRYRSQMPPRR